MSVASPAFGAPDGFLLQRIFRPQAVADVGLSALEDRVLVDEVLVHAAGRDDVVGDGVEDREIGLRLEHHLDVGEIERAVLEGREHRDADMRRAQPAVGDPAPQDRVHLRHVRAPQHECVGDLEVVVAAHRLVHAERPHEAHDSRRHAVARVGIEIVGAEAGLEQLVGGIAFPDRPLARAEHADAGRASLFQRILELLGHDVEGFVPRHRREFAVLVISAVASCAAADA